MVLCRVTWLSHVVVCPGRSMYRKLLEYKLVTAGSGRAVQVVKQQNRLGLEPMTDSFIMIERGKQ